MFITSPNNFSFPLVADLETFISGAQISELTNYIHMKRT